MRKNSDDFVQPKVANLNDLSAWATCYPNVSMKSIKIDMSIERVDGVDRLNWANAHEIGFPVELPK